MKTFFAPCLLASTLILSAVFSSGCADQKKAAPKNPNEIVLKGSESEMKLISFLTGEYQKSHKGITMNLSGGGSAIGIRALIQGETGIANCSRKFSSDELSQAKANDVNPVPVIIAMDAVVIITHPKVGIDSLSLSQLTDLFSGKIKNWKELGGENLPVVIYSRNENSGTYHFLLDHLRIDAYPAGTHVEPDNVEIVKAVSQQPGALG